MSLSKLMEYQKQNPCGQQIEQTVVIGEEAKDLFLTDRSLGVYMGCYNHRPAKIHLSTGSVESNRKMKELYGLLSSFYDNHVLYVYAITKVSVPSKSEFAMVLASENYQSNLENMIIAKPLELFEEVDMGTSVAEVDKKFDMTQRGLQIVQDIGATLQRMNARNLHLRSTSLQNIFLQVTNKEYIVKLGIDIYNDWENSDPPASLAHILTQIFEVAKKKPSNLLSDFITLLKDPKLGKKISGNFFGHPIFLNWDDRERLVYDVATKYTHPFPEDVLRGEFTWPKDGDFDKMVDVRRSNQKSTFFHFVIFVRDKLLSHPEDLKNLPNLDTKEKFLTHVTLKVPYFWIALGRLVCASRRN